MPFFIFCSVSKMTSLKQLNLSGNDLSRDERLSDKQTNLKILDLSRCRLEKIPARYVTDISANLRLATSQTE